MTTTGEITVAVDLPRKDLLVHAIAQLPDEVTLGLKCERQERRLIETLSRGYGVSQRVSLEGATEGRWPLRAEQAQSNDGESLGWRLGDLVPRTLGELVEAIGNGAETPARRGSDEILAGARVVIVSNLPTGYRAPLFEGLERRLADVDAKLLVLFTGESRQPKRPWLLSSTQEYEHAYVGSSDLARRIKAYRPTIVVAAGFGKQAARAAWAASRLGVPFGVWSGETMRQPTAHSALRRPIRRWIVARASFALAYGWLALEYLRVLRPRLPAVICRNATPIDALASASRPNDATVEFLSVGQAIRRKRLDLAIDAFRRTTADNARLTVVGGGTELDALQSLAAGDPRITLTGALPFEEVRDHYRRADCFLFPSGSDVFGLVLPEAMGAGLATLTSAEPAAVCDLAVDGRNAIVIGDADPGRWARAIEELVTDAGVRDQLAGAGARTVSGRWTVAHSVDAYLAGLRLGLLAHRGRKASSRRWPLAPADRR